MEKIIEQTRKYLKNAYVPYSNFRVAACVETNDQLYFGANIENASYGLSNCGERSALFYAYSHGVRKEDIKAIYVVTTADTITTPCGACRQVMAELMPRDAKVILANDDETQTYTVEGLLPHAFDAESM